MAASGVEAAFRMLEGRWKVVIIFHLFDQTMLRFSELERAILGVSQVGADRPHVERCLQEVVRFIDELQVAELGSEHVEFLHY